MNYRGKKSRIFFTLIIFLIVGIFFFYFLNNREIVNRPNFKHSPKSIEIKLRKNLPVKQCEFETYVGFLMRKGKMQQAIETAQKYKSSYPTKARPYFYLGLLYFTESIKTNDSSTKTSWKNKAIEELTTGKQYLEGESFFQSKEYGQIFENLGFFEDALLCYQKALASYKKYDIGQALTEVAPKLKNKVAAEYKAVETLLQQDIERVGKKCDKK